ncbi:nitroreductase [Bacillus sp. B1-b2]|uniref:nitroreductase family protein n=1 Tax=Bacillus sp. B1-b2 TaxID=2653201 RepID=UPI0012615A68|nr:nitroreductase [Bacillus sp. B1-b2]KAB7669394.1 nitroreductase [Bacillus sp. B1-b2]
MGVSELIKSRRTIKKFKTDEIDQETLKGWLEVSTYAPNHKMTEPWKVVFIGEETRKQLNHKTNFGNAPTLIAILSHKGRNTVEREENYATVSCFIQNFMLLAWESEVGTFWSSIGTSNANKNVLKVSEDFDLVGVIAVGYPEEITDIKERSSIEEKITYLP